VTDPTSNISAGRNRRDARGRRRPIGIRPRCSIYVLGLLLLALRFPVAAAEPSDQEVLKTLALEQPRDKAVKAGLEFLRKQQRPDGSGSDRYATALTAMSVMAHFAAGHPPADKQHGPWLAKSIAYVLSKQNSDGYFGDSDGSRMYGHGIATLMLAEALGMPRDDELDEAIRQALKKAAQVTINAALVNKSPEHAGGWRYTPDAADSDLSLSGWQLMSLHATQQVGISVPEKVIAGAVEYTTRTVGENGQVGYQNPYEDHPALRGLALLALVIGHQEKSPLIKKIAEQIEADPIAWKGDHFYYRVYYDAVGISRALPQQWELYLPKYEAVLLPHQNPDGSFDSSVDSEAQGGGPVYATAMAVMALAVQRHVLPAYQR
jgi:Squalene-hopene cyclase C-terminal domain/Prenyltransferase and squalene oxidase repeat